LLAIYLVRFFTEQRAKSEGDENFNENDYKKLFEFQTNTSSKVQRKDIEAGAEKRE
jgi:hypothetical protein